MRNAPNLKANRYRIRGTGLLASDDSYGNNGAFSVPLRALLGRQAARDDVLVAVIVSDRAGWDHVSVSLQYRCPTWEEMSAVKDLFFREDEVVYQLHPRKADHVNQHPFCLHLWRCQASDPPLPPAYEVGWNDSLEGVPHV